MASIWMRDDSGELIDTPIDGPVVTLPPGSGGRSDGQSDRRLAGITLVRAGGDLTAPWAVIAGSAVGLSVNGDAVPTGIRVLASRDEIRWGRGAAVFTDEHHARLEPFPGAPHPVRCARCTCDITPGSPAVRCPVCGSWYHQQEHGDFPCWTAVPFCQMCGCATATGGDAWTPEEI